MKPCLPILVVLLLLSSSVVGVGNQKKELLVEREEGTDYYSRHYFPEGYNYAQTLTEEDIIEISSKETFTSEKKHIKPLQTSTSGGPMDSPWSMRGHDVFHTGRSPYGTVDNPGDEIWRFKTKNEADCSPVIDKNGTIYIGSTEFYAVYPNGTLKWKYDVPYHIETATPAINENGVIYVGTIWAMPNYLYAFYTSNGTLKWKYKTGNDIDSSPTIGDDGSIYFGDWSGWIHAVYPNGTMKWRYQTGDVVTSSPAIGNDGTVYIGSHDDYVYAFYPDDGTVKWKFKTGSWVHGSPTIGTDETIYIGSDDGYLYALYHNNGTMKWRCHIGATWASPSLDEDGNIYIGVWEKKFYAIYPNGTVKWTFDAGDHKIWGSSAAISATGTIYFGTVDMEYTGGLDIVALNSNGTLKWRYGIGTIFSSPAIGKDGTVYIGSWGGLRAYGIGELESDTNGPYYGLINKPVQLKGSASGGYRPYLWHWDFGDGNTSDEQNPTHTYSTLGNYTVTLTVTDNTSNQTIDNTWAWIQETNDPPSKPSIDGETNGKKDESYDYTFITSDPDENNIWYHIGWGDKEIIYVYGPYHSGEPITLSYTWTEKGNYTITCWATDVYDEASEVATLEVTMPKSYNPIWWLHGLLDRFPLLQRLLEWLMW